MEIFTIIVFGILLMRSLKPFGDTEIYKDIPKTLASLIIFISNLIAYVWFLRLVIDKF